MTLAAEKSALRKDVFARRKEARAGGEERERAANARLLARIAVLRGQIVSGYRPIRTEIDPTWTMERLSTAGARTCLPIVEGEGQPLTFREWTPGNLLKKGAFGADIPVSGAWLTPEIIITPLVGWDRTGARLGYGGGFYDRTLSLLRSTGRVVAIGFAFAAQEVERIPTEDTDQRLDAIVTEEETIAFH